MNFFKRMKRICDKGDLRVTLYDSVLFSVLISQISPETLRDESAPNSHLNYFKFEIPGSDRNRGRLQDSLQVR